VLVYRECVVRIVPPPHLKKKGQLPKKKRSKNVQEERTQPLTNKLVPLNMKSGGRCRGAPN